jgi:acetolactate synthase-1/2/3 large subunit
VRQAHGYSGGKTGGSRRTALASASAGTSPAAGASAPAGASRTARAGGTAGANGTAGAGPDTGPAGAGGADAAAPPGAGPDADWLGLPTVVVVYDDETYGAEAHHFGPDGHPLDTVRFPPADIASIGAGFGCAAITVRAAADLQPAADWLAGPRDKPLLIDAKVTSDRGSWWLEEAFRGH